MDDSLTLLKPKLARLKLSGMLETLEERLRQSLSDKWSPVQLLHILFQDEIERRDHKQLGMRLTRSGLDPQKTIQTFDFTFNPKIHEPAIKGLAACDFITDKNCLFLLGPSGVGKSHLAQAIGHEACLRNIDVMFRRTYSLFQWIHAGHGDGTHARRLTQAVRIPLLILDDYGLKPLSEAMQSDLYEVICERYERRSTIITSNRDFNEWPAIFSNPLMGSAAMDRLVHRAIKIVIEGKSYRMDSFARSSKSLTPAMAE
ncbi:MAG: IS21-like element helper ATPase IstB [Leptospiraceae bacterium]|nr:IS21-like element helper ATPase IstB [Leptospiraceae bacterium]